MSHVNALFHIVFATNNRELTITNQYREDLYRFIWKTLTEKKCKLIRIGGIPNHIHLLIDLHPGISLSEIVRDIKAKSSGWLKKDYRFPKFIGWAKEYFAATVSYADRNNVIEYIKTQQEHHRVHDYSDEIVDLLARVGMQITGYDV